MNPFTTLKTSYTKLKTFFCLSSLFLLLSTNSFAQDTLFFEDFNDGDCSIFHPYYESVAGCRDSVLFMDTTYRADDITIIRMGDLSRLEIPLDTFPIYNGDTYELEFVFNGDAVGEMFIHISYRRTDLVTIQPVFLDEIETTKIQLDDFVYLIKASFTYRRQGTKLFDLLSIIAWISIDVPTYSNPSIDNLKLSLRNRVVGLSETSAQSEDEILTHINMQGRIVDQPYENQLLIRIYTSGKREKIIYKPQF